MPEQSYHSNQSSYDISVLNHVAKLVASLDLNTVFPQTLSLLTKATGAERGSFFLFNDQTNMADKYITRRDLPPERSQIVVNKVLQEGLAGTVYRSKQGAIIHDTQADERWITFTDETHDIRAALCVPFLLDDGSITGIMTLEHGEPGHFQEEHLHLAQAAAAQASVAIRNAQLFNRVETHERQLQAILQSTAEPIITIDDTGEIRHANSSAAKMLAIPEQVLIGQNLSDLAHTSIFDDVVQHLKAGISRFEVHNNTTKTDFVVHASSWHDAATHRLGHVLVFNDITRLKNLDRLKSQMIQIASHDMKNPLTVITGYTEIMLAELKEDSPHHTYVGEIVKVTDRMLEMVTQLLNVERIESTASGIVQPYNPFHLVQDIATLITPQAKLKQQITLWDIQNQDLTLAGDAAQILESFKNLVENAVKYTPRGGKIEVLAYYDPGKALFHFEVSDNGYGIKDELQANIFQRFYRAKTPGTERITGTGLGLSLVKAVVERHGGQVWFKSEEGAGSTFGLWLPTPKTKNESR